LNTITKKNNEKKYKNSTGYIIIYFGIISFLTFWFLSRNGYIYTGTDAQFHINRLEELVSNYKLHNFFPFVSTFSANRVGIGTNIFYPALWLVPFVFFRLIMQNPIHAIYAGLMLINFLTCIISFFTFKSFSKSRFKAFIFTNLYFFSTYRWIDILNRFDISEFIALTIIPLVFWSFYETVYKDSRKWLWLAVSMALLLYAHILSFLIITCFLLIVFLVNFRQVPNIKQTFLSLSYSAFIFLLLTVRFLFTFIKTYLTSNIQSPRPFELSETALSIGNLFHSTLSNSIVGPSSGFNLGLITFAILILVYRYFRYLPSLYKQLTCWLAICLIFSTNLFPWLLLQNTGIAMIQFPWRLFIIANFLLNVIGAEIFSFVKIKNATTYLVLTLMFLSLGSISQFVSVQQHDKTMNKAFIPYESLKKRYSIKINRKAYRYLTVTNPNKDYIPLNSKFTNNQNRHMYDQVVLQQMILYYKPVAIHQYKSIPNGIIWETPKIGRTTTVSMPFYIYQKHNYRVWVNDKRVKFNIDRYKLLKLKLGGTNNKVKIQYFPTLAQKSSIAISIFSFTFIALLGINKWIAYIKKL